MIKQKIKVIGTIVLLIIIILIILSNYPKIVLRKFLQYNNFYGEAIDEKTGVINNSYFDIYSDGTHEQETTKGINDAIEYAIKHNIPYIKLQTGEYKIKNGTTFNSEDGLIIKSNIIFDLNGSTIYNKENNSEHYSIISIFDAENITIMNGTIMGDKEKHIYSENGNHQWGFGIDIRNSNNIEIKNIEIKNMTGDGIYISNLNKGKTENIKISENYIHDCRRMGITIICAENVTIKDNEIFDIGGLAPQSGIDLEANNTDQSIKNIKIINNRIYSTNYAIICSKRTIDAYIEQNIIVGKINVSEAIDELTFINNIIETEVFNVITGSDKKINYVRLDNNNFSKAQIKIRNIENIDIIENILKDSKIEITSSNGNVIDNEVTNTKNTTQNYAFLYKVENDNKYTIYHKNNTVLGLYKKDINIYESENLNIVK